MTDEQRHRIDPIPSDLKSALNDVQILSLRRIEGFGWDLRFVRRAAGQPPVVVVSDPNGKTLGILDEDGRLNLEHGLRIRP